MPEPAVINRNKLQPLSLLDLYLKVQELLRQKSPAYPTNVLSVELDTHTDPEGRAQVTVETLTEHELQADIAVLVDPAPNPPSNPQPAPSPVVAPKQRQPRVSSIRAAVEKGGNQTW